MSDSEDEEQICISWVNFEKDIWKAIEKVCYTHYTKLEKKMTHILGYRERNPEEDELRYEKFTNFVKEVYLIPSLYDLQPKTQQQDDSFSWLSNDLLSPDTSYEWE